ncbi:hypothetical protein LJK88_07010 [Paenibacillus sp. P26]|nr:hypothetical protein LJK88_07010 [Paenibacillus sp. P26]
MIRLLYSLKNRLIAFFVVLLVLSFGTMSYFLFHESRSIIRSYIESSALEKMDEYGSFVNMALTQIYDLSSLVFNSPVTKSWDTALSDPALPDGEKMLADLRLSEFLTQTTNNYSGVSSVTIYRREGMWVGGENQVVMDRSFQQESWYRDFMSRGVQWVSAHSDPAEARRSKPYQVVSLLLAGRHVRAYPVQKRDEGERERRLSSGAAEPHSSRGKRHPLPAGSGGAAGSIANLVCISSRCDPEGGGDPAWRAAAGRGLCEERGGCD